MRMKSKVGPKGQAVIPKEIRDILGIEPGSEVVFEVTEKGVLVRRPANESDVDELASVVPRREKLKTEVDFKRLILSEVQERWST